ncbi:hypothetical protein F4819DRAFT_453149 [Hypoxylon fuscum]|nr:hypothetical protein F4819DRAFT_453149 [Hypoxylon fuscum]
MYIMALFAFLFLSMYRLTEASPTCSMVSQMYNSNALFHMHAKRHLQTTVKSYPGSISDLPPSGIYLLYPFHDPRPGA